ncbi:cyanophycinase-like [Littorina saxatilis]|uniref:Cyanophycinase n=1 Tax=Littorina saxatilis TaxID=31220 RepID=A0AAN9AXD6_9CAEN
MHVHLGCTLLLVLLVNEVLCRTTSSILQSQLGAQGRSLVLVGGALSDNNAAVYNTIVQMAGGKGQARIGIVTSASLDPNTQYQGYSDVFINRYGAAATLHINVSIWDSSVAIDDHLANQVRNMTGFFFGGGDQSRTVQAMYLAGHKDSPVLSAIRDQFMAGAVIAGSSAGSACQPSSVMVTGGVSWDALKDGAQTSSKHTDDLTYNPDGGLGFLEGYVIDTHFANRGREGRMIRLLSDTYTLSRGTRRGVGIDENTALVVTHASTSNGRGQVLGEAGVTFFDLTSSYVDQSQRYFSIRNVYLTYLTHGDVYHLHDHDVTFAQDKTPLLGNENYDHALTSTDIFYGKSSSSSRKPEFLRVAASIFDARLDSSSYGTTYEKNPTFRVEMSKTGQSAVGYVKRAHDFHTDLHSYKNMYVSIHAA